MTNIETLRNEIRIMTEADMAIMTDEQSKRFMARLRKVMKHAEPNPPNKQ